MFSITPISGCPSFCDHLRGALGDALRGRLRRRHERRLGARQQLPEREADVAGAGRHVDQQVVERAPVDVGEELLERAVQHRAAPHDRPPSSRKKPIDITLRPCATGGTIILSTTTGRCWMPSMPGIEKP